MNPGQLVRLWLSHPKVGDGVRHVLVLARGTKWAKVYYEPLAYQFDLDLRELDKGQPVQFNRRAYRARARANARARERLGLGWSKPGLEKAMEVTR